LLLFVTPDMLARNSRLPMSATEQSHAGPAHELLPLVYDELRKLAAHKLALLPPGQTLQATVLVHDAWLKLTGGEKEQWQSRRHFFAAAAEAMRHILIDRARRRMRARHGAKAEKIELDAIEIPEPAKDEVLLLLNDALDQLQTLQPERAEIVKLRFFAGFSEPEVAALLDISERSVQRHWSCAKAWLFERVEALKAP
jgi:RNA polymerase sigma factor (TIGR02999 family)